MSKIIFPTSKIYQQKTALSQKMTFATEQDQTNEDIISELISQPEKYSAIQEVKNELAKRKGEVEELSDDILGGIQTEKKVKSIENFTPETEENKLVASKNQFEGIDLVWPEKEEKSQVVHK